MNSDLRLIASITLFKKIDKNENDCFAKNVFVLNLYAK